MTISSPGLGSNLDVNSIVSQLMTVEQAPLNLLAKKQAGFQAKISALGSLQGAISGLQTVAGNLVPAAGTTAIQKFAVLRSALSDSTVATASVSSSAVAGTYSLSVTQLAKQHVIRTSGGGASPFTGSGGTLPKGGALTIALGSADGLTLSKTTTVTIADGASPDAVRDAINNADAGVSALVINGSAGKQLILTGDTAGSNQFIKLSGVAGLSYALPAAKLHSITTASGPGSPFSGDGGTLPLGGTLTIALGSADGGSTSQSTDLTVAAGATPETIRDQINHAGAGVSAQVIDGGDGKQLVVTASAPGDNQFVRLSGAISAPFYTDSTPVDTFTQTQAAQGSAFTLNDIAVTAETNTVTTAIDGVTLNLLKGPEAPASSVNTTLTITKDTSGLSAQVNSLVKAFNDYHSTAANLGSYDATTQKAGALNGDGTLLAAEKSFRSVLSHVPSELSGATWKNLSDIGVSLQKNGSLTVDSNRLVTAIAGDATGVANLLAAYGKAFKSAADSLVGSTGLIPSRTQGLNSSINDITKQSAAVSQQLTQIEARYRKQFTALDVLISGMTKTSTFLTQQLANLPKFNTSNN
ncbi:MAG TPA: flagellar filament capping protein FliD [Accumulibacter sp.]|uniref:flagellar filament capping protein FliD n=1 Tax=Accumulibacter sp. TaxID=2053492 RepID=UPI0025CD2098|nr:flagellar filament capping protein FliD [Accumulibacter sp.]MCM8664504.1 flagellar filament capping protein FliD [Accumulibacter sp.]HNC51516.1 flagellar filament capping protein FliD [Accumulibacter sp.]